MPWDDENSPVATFSVFHHTPEMAIKFYGAFQELKDRLLPLDLQGEWEGQPNGVWKFRCKDKAGLLWSETKGTIWFDGPPAAKVALSAKIEPVFADGVIKAPIDA
jgi:hypothetical protein